jgi:hypothetical protein
MDVERSIWNKQTLKVKSTGVMIMGGVCRGEKEGGF